MNGTPKVQEHFVGREQWSNDNQQSPAPHGSFLDGKVEQCSAVGIGLQHTAPIRPWLKFKSRRYYDT